MEFRDVLTGALLGGTVIFFLEEIFRVEPAERKAMKCVQERLFPTTLFGK